MALYLGTERVTEPPSNRRAIFNNSALNGNTGTTPGVRVIICNDQSAGVANVVVQAFSYPPATMPPPSPGLLETVTSTLLDFFGWRSGVFVAGKAPGETFHETRVDVAGLGSVRGKFLVAQIESGPMLPAFFELEKDPLTAIRAIGMV